MPRASWRGFLRLSLVSCPISLSPATNRTKSIRLRQVWQPIADEEPEDNGPAGGRGYGAAETLGAPPDRVDDDGARREEVQETTARRITLRPHDPRTGEEVEKQEVVKGYEFQRGSFVTFTAAELKALDLESSEVIDLEKFVPRGDIDPIYFNGVYYVYPDGPIAVEALRVIGAAMANAGVAGIGRVTLSRRERAVMVEARGAGMTLVTLRAADEVRAYKIDSAKGDLDPEMVAVAGAIIKQRTREFDPSVHRDRYQEALRELIEAKMKGRALEPREALAPPPVIDLKTALKRSLAAESPASQPRRPRAKQAVKATPDRRQRALLLPVSGNRRPQSDPPAMPAAPGTRRRRRA